VDCDNGYVRDRNPQVTCAVACGGLCCIGSPSCGAFTGKVCKDGSCDGTYACNSAVIPEVISSCKPWGSQSDGGERSCRYAGGPSGNVGKMVDSCMGYRACDGMGYNGHVGNLTNSCHGVSDEFGDCTSLGRDSGSVGDVTSSCYGSETCRGLGQGGVVGLVTNSCGSQVNGSFVEDTVMGNRNCYGIDLNDKDNNSPISEITNCCQDDDQCSDVDTDLQLITKDPTCEAGYVSGTQ